MSDIVERLRFEKERALNSMEPRDMAEHVAGQFSEAADEIMRLLRVIEKLTQHTITDEDVERAFAAFTHCGFPSTKDAIRAALTAFMEDK